MGVTPCASSWRQMLIRLVVLPIPGCPKIIRCGFIRMLARQITGSSPDSRWPSNTVASPVAADSDPDPSGLVAPTPCWSSAFRRFIESLSTGRMGLSDETRFDNPSRVIPAPEITRR